MKKMFLAFLFFLILGSFNFSCRKTEESKSDEGKVEKVQPAQDMQIIVNEDQPQIRTLVVKFEPDLSLTKEGWFPSEISVDDSENIYVAQSNESIIHKFDSFGNEVPAKKFSRGQGPGEFRSIDLCLSAEGRLYVYDQRQFRLTILNQDYSVQNILKFGEMRWEFALDSKNNMYFWAVKFLPGTKDVQRLVLSKFSPTGETLSEISEYIWSIYHVIDDSIEHKYPVFKPYGMFKLDAADNLYFAMSHKYEISVVSGEGGLIKKIAHKRGPRKATEEDIKIAMAYFPWASKPRSEIIIPDRMPSIADLFIFANNYLLVITFENASDKETLAGDLFDDKGIYVSRVEVPKYYRWYSLIGPGTSNALVKKNHFYTIEADREEENFYVKRYKIICQR